MGILTPSFMDDMSWRMAEVYGAITDQILINLAHYFPLFDESKLPRSSFAYQADMLAQMGQVNRETVAIIRRGLGDADDALKRVLNDAIIKSVQAVNPGLWGAVMRGILSPPKRPILVPEQMRAFTLYYQQAAQKMNLVNTVMLESTKQAYQATVADIANRVQNTSRALDIAAGETVTGVSTWNQAAQHAMNRLKENGITGFIDHADRHWSAEAYVAMDVRTTVANTARAAVWETNADFGNDLYQVSYHNGARPLCYPWQNKVISATDNARVVYDLDGNEIQVIAQSDTSYGEAAGLFGVNCKHYPTPFIPGVSTIRGTPQDEEANTKAYAESQEQRRLERKLREQKRDVLMEKARGATQEVIDGLQAKCRQTSTEIQDFCDRTGRARHRDREGVYTKREFPKEGTYDVAKFSREQQEQFRQYWHGGGAQQGYTFGELNGGTGKPRRTLMTVEEQEAVWRQQAAEKKMQEEAAKQQAIQAEQQKRESIIADYDRRIAEVERQRMELIASGSDDYKLSDKLYAEAEKLKESRETIKNGGYTLAEAKHTVAPITVRETINLAKADIYEMPDGTRFVFKRGMDKAKQTMQPEMLVERYYKMPKALRERATKTISVVDTYNPDDAHWRKVYKNFSHSYATGGEEIAFYRSTFHDPDYVLVTLEHETGHRIDKGLASGGKWFSELSEWQEAIAKDKIVSGLESYRTYGLNSPHEDFADSIAYYFTDATFKTKMPNRSAIIERILGVGGTK